MSFSDITDHLERIVINLACTQKDDITTMLDLGIRYFDFRPGYCYGPLKNIPEFKNKIFHQHAFIPGYSYCKFLCDILNWLVAHPSEIVVVNLNFQGFEESSMKPSSDDLMGLVSAAQSYTNTPNITIGDKTDLSVIIRQLLDENKRLIFLNQIEASSDARKYDSYDGNRDKYATTNVDNILNALNQMQYLPPEDKTHPEDKTYYTVLQLQGTATADLIACSTSILDAIGPFSSDAMSPLMSTKAAFDYSTYPWLMNNVPERFSPNTLLVFLNDFVDNALVKHSIDIILKRIDLDRCFNGQISKPKVVRDLIHDVEKAQGEIRYMNTDEVDYTYPDKEKINNDYLNQIGSYKDDDLTIIKNDPSSQTRKVVAETIDSVEQVRDTTLEYKEIGQFLYMDVGRWGGDKETGDAWTRMRNFGLVCGSGAMLCNYDGKKGSSISKDPNLENIDPEVWKNTDIQKMKPLLEKLSESNKLGHVTVINALVCTDEASESPSSDEIFVFLGDIHAPVMNIEGETYLEGMSHGRIKINDDFKKIESIEKKVAIFLENIEKIELKPDIKIMELFIKVLGPNLYKVYKNKINELLKEMLGDSSESQQFNLLDHNKTVKSNDAYTIKALRSILEILFIEVLGTNLYKTNENKISKLLDGISGDLFESQQINTLDHNKKVKWNDAYTIEALKLILEILLKDQELNDRDDSEKITKDDALYWFKLYHGDGEKKGVDIFQKAGGDLCEFLKLLSEYQKNSHNKQGLISAKLVQLGDLYDFWLGLKRAFDAIDPQKPSSGTAAKNFLNFWKDETLSKTSVCGAICRLLKETEALHSEFVYGNHDSYRATQQWPDNDDKPSDHFESTGIWAEHGHQSDAFNKDSNAVIGWSAAVFGFFDPEARNLEPYLRGAETWAFRELCRRLTCIRHAACQCQMKNKRIYVMGHTHEPLLKKVHIVE
jgi:predicted phosphodiesterase